MSGSMFVQQMQVFSPHHRSQSQYLYDGMRTHGWLQRLRAIFRRRSRQLLALSAIEAANAIINRYDIGLQSVPICQIRGSENGADDFDANFSPLTQRTKSRWLSIADGQLKGTSLPPIAVIQVGEIYFVRDGHHRISVACALGQAEIEAEVIVWEVA